MKRRFVLAGLIGASGGVLPGAVLRAQPRPALVVVLIHGKESALRNRLDGFGEGMRELGYVEGRNYIIEVRWSDNQVDRLPALARELMARSPTSQSPHRSLPRRRCSGSRRRCRSSSPPAPARSGWA